MKLCKSLEFHPFWSSVSMILVAITHCTPKEGHFGPKNGHYRFQNGHGSFWKYFYLNGLEKLCQSLEFHTVGSYLSKILVAITHTTSKNGDFWPQNGHFRFENGHEYFENIFIWTASKSWASTYSYIHFESWFLWFWSPSHTVHSKVPPPLILNQF